MWRRHLNSETLVTTTHKEPEDMSDGTNTQVKSQMNDKCRVKIIKKEIYNEKNPLCKGRFLGKEKKKEKKRGCLIYKKKESFSDFMGFSVFSLKTIFEPVMIVAHIC